ncbi:restriction endonuclease [Brassicibacter mesophilus]|uniref:restriction endonuclease n=1 Tax=Brassicibacter mesophilus TaxID=745119 RepID=UPI003D1F63D4
MCEDYFQIDNSTEYNKNTTVKAYQSLIYHTKLNKTVRVRHKDHQIYKQKFDRAIEQLNKEWHVTKANKDTETFLERAVRLHMLAWELKPFNYKKFALDQARAQMNKPPEKPKYENQVELPKKPSSDDEKYIFKPKWYHKLLNMTKNKQKALDALLEKNINIYNEKLNKYNQIKEQNKIKENDFNQKIECYRLQRKELNDKYDIIYKNYKNFASREAIVQYLKTILDCEIEYNNLFKDIEYEIDFDLDDCTAVVDFRFPSEEEFPKVKEYKYVKTSNEVKEILFKNKEKNELIKNTYYSLYIAVAYEIFRIDSEKKIKELVLNGYYNGIDKRKGKVFEVCIMTSKIDSREFMEIDFENINPKDTFKYFSGKGVPDVSNISKVEPIRFSDTSKFKLIDSDSVLTSLSAETNLAAMDWKDFETLIRDLFELEFREQDIEIRNTQYSNDGGIDVVAFNTNPYTGGIILLQAKRYTNTVTPEPVRALKGSMEEFKAIRGILVTTSDFGGSSREFAAQNNITLINGEQLIDLFNKHNYDFHIDIEQAKHVNAD